MSLAQNFINSFERMPDSIPTTILDEFRIKTGNETPISHGQLPKEAMFSINPTSVANDETIPFSSFKSASGSVLNEENPFDSFFGFKLETPNYYKGLTGYNPLEGYTQKRYMIETMQNEAGEQNNLSRVMDEYEAAQAEFMAKALETEADGLNDAAAMIEDDDNYGTVKDKIINNKRERRDKLIERASEHRDRSHAIKIGSAFHKDVPIDDSNIPQIYPEEIKNILNKIEMEIDDNDGELPEYIVHQANTLLKSLKLEPISRKVRKATDFQQAMKQRLTYNNVKGFNLKKGREKISKVLKRRPEYENYMMGREDLIERKKHVPEEAKAPRWRRQVREEHEEVGRFADDEEMPELELIPENERGRGAPSDDVHLEKLVGSKPTDLNIEIRDLDRIGDTLYTKMSDIIEEFGEEVGEEKFNSSKISDIFSGHEMNDYLQKIKNIFSRNGYNFKPTGNTTINVLQKNYRILDDALRQKRDKQKVGELMKKDTSAKKITKLFKANSQQVKKKAIDKLSEVMNTIKARKTRDLIVPQMIQQHRLLKSAKTPLPDTPKKIGGKEIQLSELGKSPVHQAKVLSVSGKPLPDEEKEAIGGGGETRKKTWDDFKPVTNIFKTIKVGKAPTGGWSKAQIGSANATAINNAFKDLGIVRNYHENTTINTIEIAISKITGILKGKPKEVVDFEQHVYEEDEFTPVKTYLKNLGVDKDTILTPDQLDQVNEYLTTIDFPTIGPTDPESGGLRTTPKIVRQKISRKLERQFQTPKKIGKTGQKIGGK
jgi:hypothetical protein